MEYKVHYEGATGIMHHDHNSQIRLAPNLAAESPVYLNAVLSSVLGFREAFGVFDCIVTSDMRERLANNGAFDEWLLQQYKFRDLAKKPVRKSDDEEMAGLKRQLREHAKDHRRNLYTYFKAQKRYLKYKYEKYL